MGGISGGDREGAEKEEGRAMKTPDVIKKAVRVCMLREASCMNDCPYFTYLKCRDILCADVLSYIERLEAEREGKSNERNA